MNSEEVSLVRFTSGNGIKFAPFTQAFGSCLLFLRGLEEGEFDFAFRFSRAFSFFMSSKNLKLKLCWVEPRRTVHWHKKWPRRQRWRTQRWKSNRIWWAPEETQPLVVIADETPLGSDVLESTCHAQLEATPQFGMADWEGPIPICGF